MANKPPTRLLFSRAILATYQTQPMTYSLPLNTIFNEHQLLVDNMSPKERFPINNNALDKCHCYS